MDENILIPGAGGFAAINAIKSLKNYGFKGKIVSTDSNPLSAGFYLADSFYVLPRADDASFMEKSLEIIQKEKIDLILPTSGFDIIPYSKNKNSLDKIGVTCFFSDYEIIDICNNKYQFYQLIKNDFPVPKFYREVPNKPIFPVFVKPNQGKGSRNIHICKNIEELNSAKDNCTDMIYSEYLPGKEFTIDVLSDLNGKSICSIPRERIETKAGISFKGRVVKNEKMQQFCMNLADYIGLKGPSCMQMKEDKHGELKFIEVNPRMGGGTIMATLAGINIPLLSLELFKKKKISSNDLNFKEITVLRYYEEIVIGE